MGRSKSIEAQTYWSAGTASSAYARMVSSNLAGRDFRRAILQPGTERLAGDGAWSDGLDLVNAHQLFAPPGNHMTVAGLVMNIPYPA